MEILKTIGIGILIALGLILLGYTPYPGGTLC